jgi:periplasmic copper chaperone A
MTFQRLRALPAASASSRTFEPRRVLAAFAIMLAAGTASAQEYQAGEIAVRNPFATPTPPGARIGAAYFGALENRGTQPDRLLRASSAASARVELHSGEIGADGVMRMRELDAISLPPGAAVELRPGQGNHLMLMNLKEPLVPGQSFPMTLEFERAGTLEVKVVVQASRAGSDKPGHKH